MNNTSDVGFRLRVKELFIDWLVISAYLLALFAVTGLFYWAAFRGIPEFSETGAQLIAFFASVVPVVLIFAALDAGGGSIGKRKAGLTLYFERPGFGAALVRNIVKFLPWQLGHMGTIRGMYTEFDGLSIGLELVSVAMLIILLGMGVLRKDKRHLGDVLAGTQVRRTS
ncbi:MAG: RDD family protein [Actinomycetaceae bacterium]|nr:RDD family protein [Actinomycetaceae bacterium]